ncbi:MAG: CotH kinase family protein [Butyrivibrio sp.]|nr:CotH kinase family protein [Butyrivibrio sp.]
MSTHKLIDKVCIFITIIAVLVTVLFMNGSAIGITADDSVEMGYEELLFDDSYVHTIDIEIDDWDGFLETATSEEYSAANVTIDGETVYNVGIRGKGNTSLSTVEQLDSDRYSFKIEFDCYESSNTYHGLDKLCLNNLIQDYTMMKDYLAYKLMGEFGVDAPLVSYVYITVNGEDWGLYLAVEAVEDSFLERNNGTNYGNLYKPDTLSMGGGRGNGGDFDMKDVDFDKMGMENPFENGGDGDGERPEKPGTSGDSEDRPEMSEDFDPSNFSGDVPSGGPDGNSSGGPGEMGMGSDDSKLKYIDDDIDSYSNIFDSAKTNIKKSDKKRLINSLKTLSEGIEEQDADKIAEAVDVDAVMRYMVVHNFLVNGDSYTGSMIHNYYLYEEDSLLSMIPWDYNLAYGTFQGQDADAAVNDPIDTPLSITEDSDDRPMFSWITSCDEYTEMYHEYYTDFLEQFYTSGYLQDLIQTTYDIISEYVEKDPTKFCTTEEFETAVETMKTFVELRCQSISGQLDGTIGSTDAEQEENPDALIDASSINLSDMGSMGGGMGGGPGQGDGEHSGPPSGGSDQNSDG